MQFGGLLWRVLRNNQQLQHAQSRPCECDASGAAGYNTHVRFNVLSLVYAFCLSCTESCIVWSYYSYRHDMLQLARTP